MAASLNSLFRVCTCRSKTFLPSFSQFYRRFEVTPIQRENVHAFRSFSSSGVAKEDENMVSATFLDETGEKLCTVSGPEGSSLYTLLTESVECIDGFGTCGGELACTSCHVIFSTEDFNRLPDKMGVDESDLLFGRETPTETSRLGCQVKISKELSGISVVVPL